MCVNMGRNRAYQPFKVREDLQKRIIGSPTLYFRELPSTNDMAKELALRGVREGTVVVARTQNKGRGRQERKWISPEGGLWLSILLRPRTNPKHAPVLTLLASVAVAKTLNRSFQLKSEIKWPNDVLVNMKKICGILTETRTKRETLEFAVVGIGINANFAVDALPAHLRDSSTTLQEELKREVERETLLHDLLLEIESSYKVFVKGQFTHILDEWRGLATFLGAEVEVESHREKVEGRAVNIDSYGALIVKLRNGTLRRVLSGDLRIIEKSESR